MIIRYDNNQERQAHWMFLRSSTLDSLYNEERETDEFKEGGNDVGAGGIC